MSKHAHTFDPDYAVPPGATLLETIDSLGLTQKELALRMGLRLKTIKEIIKGIAEINAETALKLEKVTGIPASFWNNAEANYREGLARLKEAETKKEDIGLKMKTQSKDAMYSCLEKLLHIHRQMKKELGREPTTEEISKETKIEPRVIKSLMGMACMGEEYDCLCRAQDMPMAEPEEVES